MLNPGNKGLGETIATRNFLSSAAFQCNVHLFIVGSGSQRIFVFSIFGSGGQRIFIFFIFGSGGQRIFISLIFGSGGQRIFMFFVFGSGGQCKCGNVKSR